MQLNNQTEKLSFLKAKIQPPPPPPSTSVMLRSPLMQLRWLLLIPRSFATLKYKRLLLLPAPYPCGSLLRLPASCPCGKLNRVACQYDELAYFYCTVVLPQLSSLLGPLIESNRIEFRILTYCKGTVSHGHCMKYNAV